MPRLRKNWGVQGLFWGGGLTRLGVGGSRRVCVEQYWSGGQWHKGALKVTRPFEVIDFWDQDISQSEIQFEKNQCFTFSSVWLKKEK